MSTYCYDNLKQGNYSDHTFSVYLGTLGSLKLSEYFGLWSLCDFQSAVAFGKNTLCNVRLLQLTICDFLNVVSSGHHILWRSLAVNSLSVTEKVVLPLGTIN